MFISILLAKFFRRHLTMLQNMIDDGQWPLIGDLFNLLKYFGVNIHYSL